MRELAVWIIISICVVFWVLLFRDGTKPTDNGFNAAKKQYPKITKHIYLIAREESDNFKLDYKLVLAIIQAESQFKITAVSKSNCRGLMQINPRYHYKGNIKNLFNPRLNIKIGCRLLKNLLNRNKGNLILTLKCYERGCNGRGYNWKYIAEVLWDYMR